MSASVAVAAASVKSPTKAAAPPVPVAPPVSTIAGVHNSLTTSKQAVTTGSTPCLPPRGMKSSVSMDTGKDLSMIAANNAVPSVSIAVEDDCAIISTAQGSAALAGTKTAGKVASGVHFPVAATVSLGVAEGASTSRAVGPTPLPRTKRGPSKRSGQIDAKSTPRRNFSKINRKGSSHLSDLHRPCLQHSFITEATDVQEMEQGLLHLLDDFHSGNLKAFVKDCSFEKMDNVREQQERLARLHFDLGSQQEAYGTLSEEGQLVAKDHLAKLMTQLQELSTAIEQLQSSTSNDGSQESQR